MSNQSRTRDGRRRGRTTVPLLCPECAKPIAKWLYDPRIGEPRGDGRGRNQDIEPSASGRTNWVRYRCRGCRYEVKLPTALIVAAHGRAVGDSRSSFTVEDLAGVAEDWAASD